MTKFLRRYLRMIDVLLTILLIAVVSTSLRDEVSHEWLGLALIILMAGHLWLNRGGLLHPLARIASGKAPTTQGILRLITDILLMAILVCMAWSTLVISQHALWWLPQLPGAADARAMHMACSYWLFVLSFIHAGQHVNTLPHPILCLVCVLGGIWAAWQLHIPAYLLLRLDYPIVDLTTPLGLVFLEHTLVAGLASLIGKFLQRAAKKLDTRLAKADAVDATN